MNYTPIIKNDANGSCHDAAADDSSDKLVRPPTGCMIAPSRNRTGRMEDRRGPDFPYLVFAGAGISV